MEDANQIEVLRTLPTLPEPNLRIQRGQSAVGCTTVVSITFALIGISHVAVHLVPEFPANVREVLFVLLYSAATVAIVCLAGLMLGDPGVIRRSAHSTFPLPLDISERLAAGSTLSGLDNIRDGTRTFCVRCFVWRDEAPPGLTSWNGACHKRLFSCRSPKPHHCSVCQRCVAAFDHHCGFFGRCIAGRGLGGNMGFFCGVIAAAWLGLPSTVAIVAVAASFHFTGTAAIVAPVAVLAVVWLCCGRLLRCLRGACLWGRSHGLGALGGARAPPVAAQELPATGATAEGRLQD